jgi:hypothetical protein
LFDEIALHQRAGGYGLRLFLEMAARLTGRAYYPASFCWSQQNDAKNMFYNINKVQNKEIISLGVKYLLILQKVSNIR